MFETPHYVAEIYQKKEDLRVLRENVLLVVRDYNRFVGSIILHHVIVNLIIINLLTQSYYAFSPFTQRQVQLDHAAKKS